MGYHFLSYITLPEDMFMMHNMFGFVCKTAGEHIKFKKKTLNIQKQLRSSYYEQCCIFIDLCTILEILSVSHNISIILSIFKLRTHFIVLVLFVYVKCCLIAQK